MQSLMTETRMKILLKSTLPALGVLGVCLLTPSLNAADKDDRPNILIAISDDQSFAHTSATGCKALRTPAFDRVAKEGVLFRNAFRASPGCSPCRASLLTGRHPWQIEQAGTHASSFPTNYVVFPDLLEAAGYAVGYKGKGWGPGDWKVSGRKRNPAGPEFGRRTLTPPFKGMKDNDYAGNFQDFLAGRPKGRPFCFWYGGHEPHRGYEKGSGLKAGKKLEDVVVPPFLPDTPEVRSDILDYCVEIEWFDTHLARMLKALEDAGELDNTLVVVTGDNGPVWYPEDVKRTGSPTFPAQNEAPGQLYNLADDPSETKNLAADKPEIVTSLKQELARIQRATRTRP
jgi:N-sulfoglucosamine sulfohydrolase